MPPLPCFHCGEPIAAGAAFVARIGSLQQPVCCIGCQAAAEWIASLGLQDYYRLRAGAAERVAAPAADLSGWDRPQLQKLYVHHRPDGGAAIDLLVEIGRAHV